MGFSSNWLPRPCFPESGSERGLPGDAALHFSQDPDCPSASGAAVETLDRHHWPQLQHSIRGTLINSFVVCSASGGATTCRCDSHGESHPGYDNQSSGPSRGGGMPFPGNHYPPGGSQPVSSANSQTRGTVDPRTARPPDVVYLGNHTSIGPRWPLSVTPPNSFFPSRAPYLALNRKCLPKQARVLHFVGN